MQLEVIEFDADQKQKNKIFYVLHIFSEYRFEFCVGYLSILLKFFSDKNNESSRQVFASKIVPGQTLNKSIQIELKKYFEIESFELIPPIYDEGFGVDNVGNKIRKIAVNIRIPFSENLVNKKVLGLDLQWSAYISENIKELELTKSIELIKSCNDKAKSEIPNYKAKLFYIGSEPTHIPEESRTVFGYIGEINTNEEAKYLEVLFDRKGVKSSKILY